MRRISRRPSPATVIAIIALIVACSGTAVAASGMISGTQVIDGSLTGRDIRPGTVQRSDLAADARPGATTTREAHHMGFAAEVRCEPGEIATGGGGSAHLLDVNEPILDNGGRPVGWRVGGHPDPQPAAAADSDAPVAMIDYMARVYAICEHH